MAPLQLNNARGTAYRDTAGRLYFWQLKKTMLLINQSKPNPNKLLETQLVCHAHTNNANANSISGSPL